MPQQCFIFDLDGTLADLSHRLHHITKEPKDYRAFFAEVGGDKPIQHMRTIYLIVRWHMLSKYAIVVVSGRSDECRDATVDWLAKHVGLPDALYMRKEGDHRPDYVVKRELLGQLRADGYEPIIAFDDRDQVVRTWRENGVPCAQVAEGNF